MKEGSRKSDDYFEKHRDELDSFKTAYRYISDVMNGNKEIPLASEPHPENRTRLKKELKP
jgi:hypothetical protein